MRAAPQLYPQAYRRVVRTSVTVGRMEFLTGTGQRLGVALALWAVLAALETGSSTSLKLGLALGIALAVIDGQAVHAVSVRPLAAGLVTNALHVAAMGTWVGTVIALLVAWQAAGVTQLRAAIARRAGRVASIALLVATGSGALLTFQHLTGTGDLASTFYGRVIVAKVAALIVILALASPRRRQGGGAPQRWWPGGRAPLIPELPLAAVVADAGEMLTDPTRAFVEGYDPSGNDFFANVPERTVLLRIRADFDNDGIADIALSESSTWGNAGGQWLLFRGQSDGSYVYWATLFFSPGAASVRALARGTSEMTLYVRMGASRSSVYMYRVTS